MSKLKHPPAGGGIRRRGVSSGVVLRHLTIVQNLSPIPVGGAWLLEEEGASSGVVHKYGKITEDCIPDGVFPIGDDVFVFASSYYDSVSVHIRRFKKYGKTYYPTPEGITLDPRWIEYIMRKKKVPESLEELPQVDFSLLNDTFK
ncbi:hypothetical protein TNCV_1451321 [Trichonephila clavipes]|nr:hypothetical protein TNCV_1451321 [Trichonephila clavipes]